MIKNWQMVFAGFAWLSELINIGRILKAKRIVVLWLGEILPDIDQIPGEPGQKIVIKRARRPEITALYAEVGTGF